MTQSYPTATNPTVEQWLEHHEALFMWLRSGMTGPRPDHAFFVPLTDVDVHARKHGISVDALLQKLVATVGDLSPLELRLEKVEHDNSTHVVLDVKHDGDQPPTP